MQPLTLGNGVERQPTRRAVLVLCLVYFPSLSKHLKAVNKSKLETCCTSRAVARKEHTQGRVIPIDCGQGKLKELCFNTRSCWTT